MLVNIAGQVILVSVVVNEKCVNIVAFHVLVLKGVLDNFIYRYEKKKYLSSTHSFPPSFYWNILFSFLFEKGGKSRRNTNV